MDDRRFGHDGLRINKREKEREKITTTVTRLPFQANILILAVMGILHMWQLVKCSLHLVQAVCPQLNTVSLLFSKQMLHSTSAWSASSEADFRRNSDSMRMIFCWSSLISASERKPAGGRPPLAPPAAPNEQWRGDESDASPFCLCFEEDFRSDFLLLLLWLLPWLPWRLRRLSAEEEEEEGSGPSSNRS